MHVTIVGAGTMGRAIATRLLAGGHDVTIIDKSREKAAELAQELGGSVEAGQSGDPLRGDVVVLAVYYPGGKDIVQQYADQLDGKVVVDICNPLTETYDDLQERPAGSAAQEIAAAAPAGARVVKAFNTTFARTLMEGSVAGEQLDVLIAGDDFDAKAIVSQLAESGGLRPIDVGDLRYARELEGAGLLHNVLQERLGTGYGSALKILS